MRFDCFGKLAADFPGGLEDRSAGGEWRQDAALSGCGEATVKISSIQQLADKFL